MAGSHLFSFGLSLSFLIISLFLSLALSLETPQNPTSRKLLGTTSPATVAQYLVPHNKIRAQMGLTPLQWDSKLANVAKWWANQRRGDCALIHSTNNYGENIFWGAGKNWQPADAVTAWFAERAYYNYQTNSCQSNEDCTHYTQLVWRQTSRIGCAKVICESGDTFITCNYDPHGNVLGQKPY